MVLEQEYDVFNDFEENEKVWNQRSNGYYYFDDEIGSYNKRKDGRLLQREDYWIERIGPR